MKEQASRNPFASKVVAVNSLSEINLLDSATFVISDSLFRSKLKSFFKSKNIPVYFVNSGEKTKSIEALPLHLKKIQKLIGQRDIKSVIALGGGSIGDFAGFFASIYKRGVNLIQIPSTWLAALDSAHGGKTALNGFDAKNQYGTFYPASLVYLCKDILVEQPQKRADEAFGELYKIALISGDSLWKRVSSIKILNNEVLWKYLRPAIAEKYKIVLRDPFEQKRIRQILNLGHTLGHVFEIKYDIHHGLAVNYGLDFCLRFSLQKGFMTKSSYLRIREAPANIFLKSAILDLDLSLLNHNEFQKLISRDKKRTSSKKVNFVFLKKPGFPLVEPIDIEEIVTEFDRQKKLTNLKILDLN